MKHFVSSILFILFGLLLAHALARIGRVLGPTDAELWAYERRLIQAASVTGAWEGKQVIVLGNSHASSIDTVAMGLEGSLVNRAGGDIFETERALEVWLPRAPDLELAIIALSYFSFGYDNSASSETVRNRVAFYANNTDAQPIPGDWQQVLLSRIQPIFPSLYLLRGDAWQGVAEGVEERLRGRLSRSSSDEASTSDVPPQPTTKCPRPSPSSLAAHAHMRAITYHRYLETMLASDPQIPLRAEEAIRDIVALARSHGLEPVFVTPPYSRAYSEAFAGEMPATLADFHARRARLAAETGARMLDFSLAQPFVDDPAAFRDSDHLNPCGAAAFGPILSKALVDSPD